MIKQQEIIYQKHNKNIILNHDLFSPPKYHWTRVKIWITSCAQLPRIVVFVYTSVWPISRSFFLLRPSVWQQVPWLSQISTKTRIGLPAWTLMVPVLVAIVDTCIPGRGAMSGTNLLQNTGLAKISFTPQLWLSGLRKMSIPLWLFGIDHTF